MGSVMYRLKNLFKTEEQINIETTMYYRKNKRYFTRCCDELGTSIEEFRKRAYNAEISGNHGNALACTAFALKLMRTQTRIHGLLERFEMLYSMQRLAGTMSRFMEGCARMGVSIDAGISLRTMTNNSAKLAMTLNKLDVMSDQLDEVFATIDGGMGGDVISGVDISGNGISEEEVVVELNRLVGSNSLVQSKPGEATPNLDDTDKRLANMKEELGE